MSDLDNLNQPTNEDDLYSQIVGDMAHAHRASVDEGLNHDADSAAEAMQLSDVTGDPAPAINANLDEYKDNLRRQTAMQLVLGNPELVTYLQAHPLAATVSNDDWGNLDQFSHNAGLTSGMLRAMTDTFATPVKVISNALKAFDEGANEGGGTLNDAIESGQQWASSVVDPTTNRLAWSGAAAVGEVGSVLLQAMQAVAGGAEKAAGAGVQSYTQSIVDRNKLDPNATIPGTSWQPLNPQAMGKEASSMVEYEMNRGDILGGEPHAPEAKSAEPKVTASLQETPLAQAIAKGQPWIDAGKEPPAGVHPLIDEAKAKLNATMLESMETDLENAQASLTKERSPEMFGKFVEQHFSDSSFEIHSDAVLGLYGDKTPEPGDGLLGWVPDIENQLAAARDTGAGVNIKISDWLSNVDPAVNKALRDDIRMWPGGITANEAKAPIPSHEVVDAPLAQMRDVAGLEPKFSMGDRKLTLMKGEADPLFPGSGEHIQMMDEHSQSVGSMAIDPDPDSKTLFVNWIGGQAGLWSNSFGPALVRDIKRQLKEMYPDHEYISGNRITGAREQAGATGVAKVKLSADGVETLQDHRQMQDIFQQGWHNYNDAVAVRTDTTGVTPEMVQAGKLAMDELRRITGGKADAKASTGIMSTRHGLRGEGVYIPSATERPTVILDLMRPDGVGIMRHEAVHVLRDYGMINPIEWRTLSEQAALQDWLGKYNIHQRYRGFTTDQKLEEAVADRYREWAKDAPEVREKTGVGAIFQKISDFFDSIKQKLGFGKEDTWEQVFQKIHSGEVGARDAQAPRTEGAFDIRGEKFSIEGDDNVRAQSVGLDLPAFRKLQELIRKSHESDIEAAQRRAEKEQTKRQTAEWKSNRADMAKEVSAEIKQRPDIAADLFVGSGELFGKSLRQRYPLAADDLTAEQKASLPDHYYAKSGLPVDQVAGMFGYGSGAEMVADLAKVSEMRRNTQGDRLGKGDFLRQMINTETDRRMEQRYGNLQGNIMDEARDQALSDGNLNIMYEELMAVALKGKVTVFDKEVIKKAARDMIAEFPLRKVNSYRLMQEMGRHSRDAEQALIAGDPGAAAVAMQKQTVTAWVAKEAKDVEKEMAQFDKTAKRMAKREVPSMEPEYTNWVHDILSRVGKKIRRTPEDLAKEISAHDTGADLKEFVKNKAAWLREVAVWEDLYDPKWKKDYKDLQVVEFRGVKGSVDSLIFNGRDERKLFKAGADEDFDVVKDQMIDSMKQFKQRDIAADEKIMKSPLRRLPRSMLANSLQLENLLNRWDKFNSKGVWNQYVMRDLIDGLNQSDAWKKEFSHKLAKLKDIDDMHRNISNPGLFRAPENYGGDVLTLNRESLHAIMLNVGNDSNLEKLAKGWGVDKQAITQWVDANATKADWERVQGVWDIFDEIKDRSDTMYRSISGVPAQSIEPVAIQNRHGTFRGGYYPIIHHPVYEGGSRKLMGDDGLRGMGFESAATPAGYTKSRTEYAAPLALDLNQLPNRLSQMIHDTALRPAVINASKVFKDPDIRAGIAMHYGLEYRDMLIPYLRGVANASNSVQKEAAWLSSMSEFMRQNLITALVGFNPGTVMKHGPTAFVLSGKQVGPKKFAAELGAVPERFLEWTKSMFHINDETSDSNWTFAVKNSLELQRRDRNWQETLFGATGELQAGGKFGKWRQRIMQWASKPVALSDMISAVPTWLAKYHEAIEEGQPHGDAVYEADRAVRYAHGSTAVTNRPMITNQVSPWLTSVYNFFNDVMNRQVETLWKAGEVLKLAKSGQHSAAMKASAGVIAGAFAYSVWPAIVENWVSPMPSNPNDSEMKKAAKAVAFTAGASWVGVRDLVNGILDARDPDVGLATTEGRMLFDFIRDWGKKEPLTPMHAQKMIRDAGGMAGAFAGVPAQIAKVASFGYGLAKGTEHPRGPWGWLVGARYGTIRGHSPTASDYMAGRSLPSH